MKRRVSQNDFVFAVLLGTYVALGIYGLQFYQYQINPDGISYLAIAEKYLRGNFAEAINGYWMPLYSWLLLPLLALGIFPLLATKILALLIGLLGLFGARRLAAQFAISAVSKNILLATLIPLFLFFAFNRISPDFLLVVVLIFYFAVIFAPSYRASKYQAGVLCGVLGSVAYFAKGYGLPFFLTHFFLGNAFFYGSAATRTEKKNVVKNFAGGLLVFCLLSGTWIFLISQKYGYFTFNTAAGYNYAIIETGDLFHNRALLPPPNATAVSYWEDPSYVEVERFAPRKAVVQKTDAVRRDSTTQVEAAPRAANVTNPATHTTSTKLSGVFKKLKLFQRNLQAAIAILRAGSAFAFVILLAALWLCFPLRRDSMQSPVFHALLALAVYAFGYLLIFVEGRYLWIAHVLLMMIATYFFDALLKLTETPWQRAGAAGMMLVVMFSFSRVPAFFLLQRKDASRQHYELSRKLKDQFALQGKIASDDEWSQTLYLSYFNGYQYYGVTGHRDRSSSIRRQLEANNIAYYFVWHDNFEFLLPYEEITHGKISGLRIYRVRELDPARVTDEEIAFKKKTTSRKAEQAPFACCSASAFVRANAPDAQWAIATRDTLRLELVESGEIIAKHSTMVAAPLIGNFDLELVALAPEGEVVDSGAVLVRFDPSLLASSLAQERFELQAYFNERESMRAEQALRMSDLARRAENAEYALQLARIDLQLMQYGSASRKKQSELEVLKAEIAVREAEADRKTAQALQTPATMQQELKIFQKQQRVNRLQERLEQMTVRAPRAGMVVHLLDENGEKPQLGEKARMGQSLIHLPDLSRMQVKFNVNAIDADALHLGQSALVHLEAFPSRHFHAKLVAISKIPLLPEADSDLREFEVVAEIDAAARNDALLKPGMTAKVNIALAEIPDQILLPLRCVYEIEGVPTVFTEASGDKPVSIKVGARNNAAIIVAGLAAGTKVAWEPATNNVKPLGYDQFQKRWQRTLEEYEEMFTEMEKRGLSFDYAARRAAVMAQGGVKVTHK